MYTHMHRHACIYTAMYVYMYIHVCLDMHTHPQILLIPRYAQILHAYVHLHTHVCVYIL